MIRSLMLLLALVLLICPNTSWARPGPNGTFRNESGVVSLRYAGEGTVKVQLRTKYCQLKADGGTFVFPGGIHVVNSKNEPVLVIFYQPGSVVVYGEIARFKQQHCKGGADATGRYKRKKK